MTTMRQRKRRPPRRGSPVRSARTRFKSIWDMAGIIKPRRGKHASIEDMKPSAMALAARVPSCGNASTGSSAN